MKKSLILIGLVLITLALFAVAAPTAKVAAQPAAQATEAPVVVPFLDAWKASGHNNVTGVQFRRWDDIKANPDGVPTSCAKCHTSAGYLDFLIDGKIDKPVPAAQAQGVTCIACHSKEAMAITAVTFPSGKVVEVANKSEGRCMTCHQGRESKVSIDAAIESFKAAADPDKVVAQIPDPKDATKKLTFGFKNVHYFAAGGTLLGSEAQMGYEYDGKAYDPRFRHVTEFDTCVACHDQHAAKVRVEKCAECHTGVKKVEDLQKVRMNGSLKDYNGNGDVKEGIAAELAGMQKLLLAEIQKYAKAKAGAEIKYDAATYPYFMGADGKAFPSWTPRLLKAAYNYQVSVKDPGAFAHNAKYIIELMFDSIEDLGGDVSKLARNDAKHFAGNTLPFRDWDDTGTVPYNCAKCHSAAGLPEFIKAGGTTVINKTGSSFNVGVGMQPTANGFMCTTCHTTAAGPDIIAVTTVPFPSGKTVTFSTEKDDKGNLKPVAANLCIECHQGRESTASMNAAILASGAKSDDEVAMKADGKSPALSFKNIHYLAAGATLFGTDAQAAYEYKDQKYNGAHAHVAAGFTCSSCHDVHALQVKTADCVKCHANAKDGLEKIVMVPVDYDGNGKAEGMEVEVNGVAVQLFAAIQKYAKEKSKVGLVYDANAYPYFYADVDGDGKGDVDDKGAGVRFTMWTPNLLRAAYDYQYFQKDPGGFAHNGKYVLQILIDSVKAVGGDVSKMTRP